MTNEQWNLLAIYFAEQSKVNVEQQRNCAALSKYARNKDASGIKSFMKKLGGKVMTEIAGAGTREILNAIKILLMG